ncbi:MAG: hypothetical protein V7647_179 [Acidobacteriota bacterium]
MDRYDESKHVDSMRLDDEVRSVDRETMASHHADRERDIVVNREADMRPDTDMPRHSDVVRDVNAEDESDMPKRQGDILGLGGSVVPKSSDDPSARDDAESTMHRRTRSLDIDEPASGTDMPRTKGVTGIDMGSGGSGTDLE